MKKLIIFFKWIFLYRCYYCGGKTESKGEVLNGGFWDENKMGFWRECLECKKTHF